MALASIPGCAPVCWIRLLWTVTVFQDFNSHATQKQKRTLDIGKVYIKYIKVYKWEKHVKLKMIIVDKIFCVEQMKMKKWHL